MLPKNARNLHFVGIGGAGMSGIAWVLLKRGYRISGSDIAQNPMTLRLAENGAAIFIGHRAENVGDVDALVVSTAIRGDNPERLAAIEKNIPVVHRADALDEILQSGRSIAIAGTHGKTTTTSMMTLAAELCGLDPTVLIGGELNDIGGNAKVGASDLVIAEADESDGSFLKYHPDYGIVTNIEPDHLDYYKDQDAVLHAFMQFINQINPEGFAVLCKDDPLICASLDGIEAPIRTYGLTSTDVDYHAADLKPNRDGISFTLHVRGEKKGPVNLKIPGATNVANSLAVLSMCEIIGADCRQAMEALERYRGVKRRFQIKGESRGITVIDDYAHHPTEIRATLGSARSYSQTHEQGRVISIFQPHRYSRTLHLSSQFGQAFADSNEVVITDVYAAGESPISGVNGKLIYERVRESGHPQVTYVESKDQVIEYLGSRLEKGDLVLTLGAGDIWKVGEDLLKFLNDDPVCDSIA